MYIFIYIYTYIYTHVYTYIIHTHIHLQIYTHIHVLKFVYLTCSFLHIKSLPLAHFVLGAKGGWWEGNSMHVSRPL